jgi:NADH-quinone oxidoreductase subunit L
VLENKYYFDRFNDWFFAGGARGASGFLWKFGDVKLIDGLMVNGTARLVGLLSRELRRFQTGYVYHYAFSMIVGVFVLLSIRTWVEG